MCDLLSTKKPSMNIKEPFQDGKYFSKPGILWYSECRDLII